MIDTLIDNAFKIDFDEVIIYDSDQVYDCYPARFATVSFGLEDTPVLVKLADMARIDAGYKALKDGIYYDFFIGLNDYNASKVDSCFVAVVNGLDLPDDGEVYIISLDEVEQKLVYDCLDRQCRQRLCVTCADLLAEARKEMECTQERP